MKKIQVLPSPVNSLSPNTKSPKTAPCRPLIDSYLYVFQSEPPFKQQQRNETPQQ